MKSQLQEREREREREKESASAIGRRSRTITGKICWEIGPFGGDRRRNGQAQEAPT